MNLDPSDILMICGMCIFVPAFLFQSIKLLKNGKSTIGVSATSWMLNFVGRFLWIIFGFLMGSYETYGIKKSLISGNVVLFGQGIVTLLTVSMLYYSIRNHKTNGEYKKELFKKWLFIQRLVLDILVFAVIIVFAMALNGVFYIPTSPVAALIVSLIATAFTGVAFLPQGIKVIKTRQTKSTSIYLTLLFAIGNSILIMSLVVKVIFHKELLLTNIGGIVFPIISTAMMFVVTFYKINNIIRLKEK